MNQMTIGIFHDDLLAKDLGKKATESDMVFFHRKTDDTIFSFIYPVEDKITPKSQIMNMIDLAIISAEKITPALGETILLLDSIHINKGIILIEPFTDTTQLNSLIKNTTIDSFEKMPKDIHRIMKFIQKQSIRRNDTLPAVATIDHSFQVKGIGEVALGFVNQGTIKKHDKLKLLPPDKEIIIRSIQIQDKDVDEAPAGSRTGLAIKGAMIDDLKRGYLICEEKAVETKTKWTLSFTKNPFYQNLSAGKFHATIGLQTMPIIISEINDKSITIESEKPISIMNNQRFIILDLNARKLHHIGTAISC
jgi:selenocysteine-specific translation elongation factor